MFDLVPFKQHHLAPFMNQRINPFIPSWIETGHAYVMAKNPESFTGIVNGTIAVVGGTVALWSGRAHLWAVFNEDFTASPVAIFRGIQKFLDESPHARIEMAVPYDLEIGHKRAKLLGMKVECERAEKYLSDGSAATLYARVR